MAVTNADIKVDVGDVWSAVSSNLGTTTTVLNSLLSRARNRIIAITGTTTGYDEVIRPLADAYTVQRIMGGLGPETDPNRTLQGMRDDFIREATMSLKVKGFSPDGLHMHFDQVNP